MYAASRLPVRRSIQENLQIDLFARKHGLTVEKVEIALTLKPEKRKTYLKNLRE